MNMYKEMSAFSINIDKQQRNLSGPEEKERIASFQEREEKGVTKSAKMLPPLIKNQVALQRIIQKTVHREVTDSIILDDKITTRPTRKTLP